MVRGRGRRWSRPNQHPISTLFLYFSIMRTLKNEIGGEESLGLILYFLRPILLFANTDVSRHILVIDIFVLAKSNMGRRD
jgi:hypothetical protein